MVAIRKDDIAKGLKRPTTPSERMRNLWIFYVILPAAVVAWTTTRRWSVTLGASISMPFLAFMQGFFGMLSYRCFFGDAPKPMSPTHGVVVVHPKDKKQEDGESSVPVPSPVTSPESCSASLEDASLLESALDKPPVRILIMGDSLAVGVGQAKTCTPVLPETIAKTISKRLGGRAVYWTCHGSPGASTGWIVKQLDGTNFEKSKYGERYPGRLELQSSFSDSEELSSASEESTTGGRFNNFSLKTNSKRNSVTNRATWKDRLESQRRIFDGKIEGPYDIAICLTGSNDLKSTFFPFLLKGEAAENWKESQERGGYTQELRRLLGRVRRIMKFSQDDDVPSCRLSNGTTHSPLVVFPAMPASSLPAFQHFPLQHLSVPMVDIMDDHKKNLATQNSGEVLFVPAPTRGQLDGYVEQSGPLWEERCREKVALTLHNGDCKSSRRLEHDMVEYYGRRDPDSLGAYRRRSEGSWANAICGAPPSHWKAFSIDKTHPNEYGYDFWGRHIASAICDELLRKHS